MNAGKGSGPIKPASNPGEIPLEGAKSSPQGKRWLGGFFMPKCLLSPMREKWRFFMGINEHSIAFVPKELEVEERPDLRAFSINIVFASLKLLTVAVYYPDLSTFEESDSHLKLRYYNSVNHNWWIEIEYSKNRGWYEGARFHDNEWKGGATGVRREIFFSYFTMQGVLENEPTDPVFTKQLAEALKKYS